MEIDKGRKRRGRKGKVGERKGKAGQEVSRVTTLTFKFRTPVKLPKGVK